MVDEEGRSRIVLSGKSAIPKVQLLVPDGRVGIELRLDENGRPGVRLSNPNSSGPTADLEIDDKGAHVKFDRPGGAGSYLFLNKEGGSWVVLVDGHGKRRMALTLDLDGGTKIERYDLVGEIILSPTPR
jgi:hypothetical protein